MRENNQRGKDKTLGLYGVKSFRHEVYLINDAKIGIKQKR